MPDHDSRDPDRGTHRLRTPGPTPLPPEVRAALARDMVNHRGPAYRAVWRECLDGLQWAFQTRNEVLILTCSGTGGLESAVVNLLSPGQKVLIVDGGFFGQRWAEVAGNHGASVVTLRIPWGQAVDPAAIATALAADPEIDTLFVTHNETSTGVLNPLPQIIQAARRARPEIVVAADGISSVGAVPVHPEAWDLDVLITGSQKGWMLPPGLCFVMVGPRAWERQTQARLRRSYFDWAAYRQAHATDDAPWTPAVGLGFALQASLQLMRAEGLEAIYARHERLARYTRERLVQMGCRLLADPSAYSPTVTTALPPDGVDTDRLLADVLERHDVTIADGLQFGSKARTKNLRVGHLGFVCQDDLARALDALACEIERVAPGGTLAPEAAVARA